MAPNHNEAPEQTELSSEATDAAQRLKREALLRAVNSCQLNTMEERVAWLLNHYPKTRDSDITLQVRYWKHFESDRFDGGDLAVSNYFRLAKLTSVARARATIQNKLKLFQASEEVKVRRKQLSENARDLALREHSNCRDYAIYVDESGKTQDYLVVGSTWYLNGSETLKTYQLVDDWKKSHKFNDELHFKSITEAKLPHYCELADLIADHSSMVSFKAISVPRRGIADTQDALMNLTSHLLLRGIQHEHETSRARLPRRLAVCKDAEEVGQDRLFVANLSDRMKQAAASQFGGLLYVDDFSAEESAGNVLLQVADLFTSSVGRSLNVQGEKTHPKDRFAEYFLAKIGRLSPARSESIGDMTVHISL